MTVMRRFIIDKMPPHFFYPPLFWPHTITGGALSHPQPRPVHTTEGRNDETSLGYDAFSQPAQGLPGVGCLSYDFFLSSIVLGLCLRIPT